MKKVLSTCCLLFFFAQSLPADNGIGRFIRKVIKEIFASPPEKQLLRFIDAKHRQKGKNKKYLESLEKIETKLKDYKDQNPEKYEVTVNLTLALINYDRYEVLEKSTPSDCERSKKHWKTTLEKYINLWEHQKKLKTSKKKDYKDFQVLLKHGDKIDFIVDQNDKSMGEDYLMAKLEELDNCPIPFSCRGILDNKKAAENYSTKLRRSVKKATRLGVRFKNWKAAGTLSEEKRANFEKEAKDLKKELANYSYHEVPIAHYYVKGTIYDILKDRDNNRTMCYWAHASWSRMYEYYTDYSYEYSTLSRILSKSLGEKLDSNWVLKKYEASKACSYTVFTCKDPKAENYDSIYVSKFSKDSIAGLPNISECYCVYKGCKDEPEAINYVGNKKRIIEEECIIVGCMDTCYTNFNPKANEPGDCIDCICTCLDTCFVRVDTIPDDIAKHHPPACDTLKKICGCTNPCAFNYNPNAIEDDGSCSEECGCKDPNAENYDPEVTYHRQRDCYYENRPIVDNLSNITSEWTDDINRIEDTQLREALRDAVRYKSIQNGGGLGVDISLNVTAKKADLALGEYQSHLFRRVVDHTIDFLNRRAGRRFDLAEMDGFVIGEADGHRINGAGIEYIGGRINRELFYALKERDRMYIPDQIEMVDTITIPPKGVSLYEGYRFKDYDSMNDMYGNMILAFLRGFKAAKQVERTKTFRKVSYGAIRNSRKGGAYRKVTLMIQLYNYNFNPDFNPQGGIPGQSVINECLCPN